MVVCIPLDSGDSVFGAIILVNPQGEYLTEDDLALVVALSSGSSFLVSKAMAGMGVST